VRERIGTMRITCPSPKEEVCEHESPSRSVPAGAFFLGGGSCPMLTTPALRSSRMRLGAEPLDRESRVDRRTACLHQADAFREKAIADPEHHDQWIDEAIKWLERAMEAGCRAVVTVEAGDVANVAGGAAADARLSLITRQ
jgi:hypothetical protein